MTCAEILKKMELAANPANVAGMARFGITAKKVYGMSIPVLKKLAREIGRDHALARELWVTEILEARILAGLVDEPQPQLNGGYTIFGQVISGMDVVNGLTRRDPNQNPTFPGDAIESVTISEK